MAQKATYVLVSTTDEEMKLEHEFFYTLEDAQAQMRKEMQEVLGGNLGDSDVHSRIEEKSGCIIDSYVYLWKIIVVYHV